MKKRIFIMLCMVFAVCQAYAQEVEVAEADSLQFSEQTVDTNRGKVSAVKQKAKQFKADEAESLTDVSSLIDGFETLAGKLNFGPPGAILMPIAGKTKFARSHYIYQTVDISTLGGSNKSHDDPDEDASKAGAAAERVGDLLSDMHFGMNFGYSIIFVPGEIKGDMLEINRFGFAYSTGFLASFDRQKDCDVACDFHAKIGVEAGTEHVLGVGINGLIGGGKSLGAIYDLDFNVETEPQDYTAWCFKCGAEIWLKTNLLSTAIKNTDVLIFARFVYSKDPQTIEYDPKTNYNFWMEEAWKFGVTVRYKF